MKEPIFAEGGRPRANDDLDTLQQEMYAAMQATLQGAPPLVLSGCQVTRNGSNGDISPGLVWLAGRIERYDGAANVALPAEIAVGDYAYSDYRAYQTGESQACMRERQLVTQSRGTAPAGTAIEFINAPVLTYWKWVESKTRTLSEVQWLTNHDATAYDATGKGWSDLSSSGWALCNGQNGTADLRERFIVAMNPNRAGYTIGEMGGEETVALTEAQNGPHNHVQPGQFAYNQVLRKAPFGSNTTASSTDGSGNGGSEPDLVTSQAMIASGAGQPHENRPPFYILAARQWIGL